MIASRSVLVIAAEALSLDTPIGSLGGRARMATIQALQLSDTSVTGGSTVTAVITLTSLASAAGDTVRISSFPRVSHPATVVVPKGSTQATFSLTTTPTTATYQVSVTATSGSSQKSAAFSIRRPVVRSVSLSRPSIQGGRDTLWMTVALDGVAPSGGIPLSVMSAPPGLATVGFPPSPTNMQSTSPASEVPAGASQVVLPLATPAVRLTRTVPVVANGQSASFELRQPPVISVLYVSSDCPVSGSFSGPISGPRTLRGTVIVRGPLPSTGAPVSLTSSSAVAVVPASVDVMPASVSSPSGGTYFGCFDIDVQPVTVATLVNIAAATGDSVKYTNFAVYPRTLSSLSIADELVRSGQMISLSVTLSAPGAPGGTIVSLASSNPAVVPVPASIIVPQNSLVATQAVAVTIPASDPSIAVGVVVTASYAGRALVDTIIVRR